MAEAAWKQLNLPETSAYIDCPLAFTGKTKNGKPSVFDGLLLSCQFVLAVIHTLNKIYGEPAKLTYDYFTERYGKSRETVSKALKTLIDRGIIERVKQSHYKIIAEYNKKDHVEIDECWIKYEWEVDGRTKRLTYSRLLTLALLKRGCSNPETGGEFVSSQRRVGTALHMPKTTAGDSLRELAAAGATRSEKKDGNDARRRGCSLFTVNPAIMAVQHPQFNLKAVNKVLNEISLSNSDLSPEERAEKLHAQLMLDNEYSSIIERINLNSSAVSTEILRSRGEDTPELAKLEADTSLLRSELERYLKVHRIKRELFPPGFFKTDTAKKSEV